MSDIQHITAIIRDKRNNILSIGKNSYIKTHPYQAKCAKAVGMPEKVYLHAEIDAIIKCSDISKAHSIHVFRQGKSKEYLYAKPCPVCQQAILQTNIKKVHHT